ncbi:MAG TPA: NADH-quinone oxidoreductase subunit NuoH [Verrucomicrobiae bacterium]|jgi:NADH-quinone oxidoreductase subunit H|nr:NADH-quinone oxidoreductase subunit NuoH [Verrucomicrobiae bacterium]
MDWNFIIFSMVKIAVVIGVVQGMVAYAVLAERKISAWIQDRVGPNRTAPPFVKFIPVVGPFLIRLGLFQPLADGLKFMFKEDFTPAGVRKIYFFLAPAIAVIPAMLTVAVIPFGSTLGAQKMVIADLNVGILYTFGIVSLGVYGIVLAGYAANSKYPFLGGIRSSAQMISYEISMGLSVIPVLLIVGNLNLGQIINWQVQHGWLIIYAPVAFIIFLVASFAETNRLPFDLPEAETELVAGYHTEYGSMKFALFFLGEYSNMIASSGMMVTLFFGGWTLPFWGLDHAATTLAGGIVHILIFLVKMLAFIVLFIWVRWMFPRFRYDQLMDLGWRRFLPLALVNILVTAIILWMRS